MSVVSSGVRERLTAVHASARPVRPTAGEDPVALVEAINALTRRLRATVEVAPSARPSQAWLDVVGACTSIVNAVAAVQDAAMVRSAAIAWEWDEDGTLVQVIHPLGWEAIDAVSCLADRLGCATSHAQRRLHQALALAADGMSVVGAPHDTDPNACPGAVDEPGTNVGAPGEPVTNAGAGALGEADANAGAGALGDTDANAGAGALGDTDAQAGGEELGAGAPVTPGGLPTLLRTGFAGLHEAMAQGRLDTYRAGVIVDELAAAPAEVVAAIVESLDPHLENESGPELRRRARRLLTRVSPDLLRQRARRARGEVGLLRYAGEPGVDTWVGNFPSEDAFMAWAAIDQLARTYVADGVCEVLGQARAKALTDLVTGAATITTHLHLTVPATTVGDPAMDMETDSGSAADTVADHSGEAGVGESPETREPQSPRHHSREPETPEPQSSRHHSREPETPEPQSSEHHSREPETPEPQSSHHHSREPETPESETPEPQVPDHHSREPETQSPEHHSREPESRKSEGTGVPVTAADNPAPGETRDPEDLVEVNGGTTRAMFVPWEWLRDQLTNGVARKSSSDWLTHPDTGALIDPRGSLSCESYRPTGALTALVKARDGHCRFPGCTINARFCDLDHVRPWPAGPTTAANLICLCRRHHRVKQSPGWYLVLRPDGTATWNDPTGRRHATHPIDQATATVLPVNAAEDRATDRQLGAALPTRRGSDAAFRLTEFILEHVTAKPGSPAPHRHSAATQAALCGRCQWHRSQAAARPPDPPPTPPYRPDDDPPPF